MKKITKTLWSCYLLTILLHRFRSTQPLLKHAACNLYYFSFLKQTTRYILVVTRAEGIDRQELKTVLCHEVEMHQRILVKHHIFPIDVPYSFILV